MRFDPEASWGANAGLEIPRKALEPVKVCPLFCKCLCVLYISLLLSSCLQCAYIFFSLMITFALVLLLQAKHPEISYADLYTLAGVVAVEEAG